MYGQLAKLATKLEIKDHKWAATTDHWTPPGSGVTYTCNTFHAIIGWKKVNILQDFQIFEGSTTGDSIFNYQNERCNLNYDDPLVFYVTVDTTGNMGSFTQRCRESGTEAEYCTEHAFHLNFENSYTKVRERDNHAKKRTKSSTQPWEFRLPLLGN